MFGAMNVSSVLRLQETGEGAMEARMRRLRGGWKWVPVMLIPQAGKAFAVSIEDKRFEANLPFGHPIELGATNVASGEAAYWDRVG